MNKRAWFNTINARKHLMKHTFSKLLLLALLISSIVVYSIPSASAATTIITDGEVTVDTTWTAANSPYIVKTNVTVRDGATLTVEPNATILFDENVMLTIEGSFIANGTNDSFIGLGPSTTPIGLDAPEPLWEGLIFVGQSPNVFTLRFAQLLLARNGITVNGTGKVIIENSEITANYVNGVYLVNHANILISNNIMQLNENGIATIGNASSDLEITRNTFYGNENGMNIRATGDNCQIRNITISENAISGPETVTRIRKRGDGIRLLSNSNGPTEEAQISNVQVLNNIVSRSLNGIYFSASGLARITDSIISNNNITLSNVGIRASSGGNLSSYIFNLTISNNVVFSNADGISLESPSASALPYDLSFHRNIVSANNLTGVEILNKVKANLTENSIAYNSHGVVVSSQNNLARGNDIYGNTDFGIYANGTGTIDAVSNYWGNSSGPFHEDLNPSGQGNAVNGNGIDLRFSPFLVNPSGVFPINDPPVAKLQVATKGAINEKLIFDATESHDDTKVLDYFFDFGDGTAAWNASGKIEHTYLTPGLYEASLLVMDDLGVLSQNTIVKTINITLPILTIYIVMKPATVVSGGTASVSVHVTNGSYAVGNVTITVASDKGGRFEADSGLTDANGDFVVNYTSPKVSSDTVVTIVAAAFKGGFINGSKQVLFPIVVRSSGLLDSPFFWGAVIGGAAVVAMALILFRRRRIRNRLIAKIRSRRASAMHASHNSPLRFL